LNRRKFVELLTGTAAWSLGGLRPIGLLAAPIPAPLRIDVHCHLYNGRDLPIYGLLESVIVEQNIFGIFAEPLALWLAASIEGNAPTYQQEIDALDTLAQNPAAAAQYELNSNRLTEALEVGMKKFIEDYTSFGHPRTPVTDRNDAFLLELLRRFAQPSVLQDGMTKDDLSKLLNDRQFRQELIERILEYRTKKNALGFADEFSEYISQFCHWVGTFLEYHFRLADDLATKFGENVGDELRIMTPAIVDFGLWPLKFWFRDMVNTADQQATLIEKVSLIRQKGRAIHGFIGFDPWRYLQELKDGSPNNSFDVLKQAIEKRGFVGVKFYPPMGFQPYANSELPNSAFPHELVHLCKGHPGRALDKVLARVYRYCNGNGLAIMAHCSDSIGSRPGYALRSAPELWRPVLDQFKNLRLNLGHFGGIWDFFFDPTCSKSENTNWPTQIGAMMKDYNNLYVDVADFSEVLERWDSEKCSTPKILDNLKGLIGNQPQLLTRMMYGSDWMMLDREPKNDDYYQAMRQAFSGLVGSADLDRFLGQNAATYLGLRPGQRTRYRIDTFYRNNHRAPPDFDRYLVS
jgi:predicted TIM-barrel fold metal-dependent hydrolase